MDFSGSMSIMQRVCDVLHLYTLSNNWHPGEQIMDENIFFYFILSFGMLFSPWSIHSQTCYMQCLGSM